MEVRSDERQPTRRRRVLQHPRGVPHHPVNQGRSWSGCFPIRPRRLRRSRAAKSQLSIASILGKRLYWQAARARRRAVPNGDVAFVDSQSAATAHAIVGFPPRGWHAIDRLGILSDRFSRGRLPPGCEVVERALPAVSGDAASEESSAGFAMTSASPSCWRVMPWPRGLLRVAPGKGSRRAQLSWYSHIRTTRLLDWRFGRWPNR